MNQTSSFIVHRSSFILSGVPMHFWETLNFGALPWAGLSLVVWLLLLLALAFDFLNGFHDAANSVATVVSTRVLSPQTAVVWAAFFNFVAFLVFHLSVAATMGKGIIDPSIVDNAVIGATLIAACAWDILTWYSGLPTSSSHALIGGMIGAAVVKKVAGLHTGEDGVSLMQALGEAGSALQWWGIGKTVLFIFLAPLIGLLAGLGIAVAVTWLFRRAMPRQVDRVFRRGQLLSAGFYSLGHGGNDAQKTMGVIFVLLIAAANANPALAWRDRFRVGDDALAHKLTRDPDPVPESVVSRLQGLRDRSFATRQELQEALKDSLPAEDYKRYEAKVVAAADNPQVPTEVVLACHIAMGLGTLLGGWRIVKTMGQRIIKLRPVDGFCAETGAALTLVLTIFFGVPVSTTHTITGAIVGVGSLKRLSAVRWGVAGRVVWAWIITIPATAAVAALCWWLLHQLG
jgi:PiT family inorganic phosphate transporter